MTDTNKEKGFYYIRRPLEIADHRHDNRKSMIASELRVLRAEFLKICQDSMNKLIVQQGNPNTILPKIFIAEQFGFRIIEPAEITYLESEGNYTLFHLNNRENVLATRSLCEFEKLIDPEHFIRIHKSYILNIAYLKAYSNYQGNFAILHDGTRLSISRRKLIEFRFVVAKFSVSPEGNHHTSRP